MKTHLITLAVPHDDDTDPSYATQLAARAVPGSHVFSTGVIEADVVPTEWDDEAPVLPMSRSEAQELMDDEGCLSVLVTLDQDTLPGADMTDHLDTLHVRAFDFGHPAAAEASIVAVEDGTLLVRYSTCIEEALDYEESVDGDSQLVRLREALN